MSDPALVDPLFLLRLSIAHSSPPLLTNAPGAPSDSLPPLSTATHLLFPPSGPSTESRSFLLSQVTRFHKSDQTPVDLRSIYFAWLHREVTIPDYISKAQSLGDGVVTNLAFLERLELVTWLEGGQDESEFIKPLPAASSDAAGGNASQQSAPASGSSAVLKHGASTELVGKVRVTDPRLLEIYSYERVVSNRNTQLRGIKPTDFSHVRKTAEDFITRLRMLPGSATPSSKTPNPSTTKPLPMRPGLPPSAGSTSSSTRPSKPSRNKDPIILLSPSASSLLTMTNIKQFLESGTFTPSSTISSSSAPSIIHVSRLLPSLHPTTPMRFIVVDSPEKFKPDYWDRVVAVFTTGQSWQFRGYKWANPVELFREVAGFYVGWEGEKVPELVKAWGSGVRLLNVERQRRFRDRECCERFWEVVERGMKGRGWGGRGH